LTSTSAYTRSRRFDRAIPTAGDRSETARDGPALTPENA
jgi:hypothetical protein